ncbi:MAG: HAD family hydrolase [Firmicutes bacterium]|nr:HAD family hydrolase [Bacillota bacterium]
MPMQPKLVAFDVDGTLLTSTHSILASTKAALQQLVQDGHHVLLATARPPRSVAQIATDLEIEHAISIALNGAMIISNNQIVWEMPMDRQAVEEIIKEARRRHLHANIMAGWHWYVETASSWYDQEAAIVEFQPEMVEDLLADSIPNAHKVLLMGDAEDIASYREWADSRSLPLNISLSKPNYCEIVIKEVSKAHALEQVAKILKIPHTNIIAFGDGENDMGIVSMAGVGVAMGNAMPEVLAVADLVTKSNNEDGIYHALLELGLIRPPA